LIRSVAKPGDEIIVLDYLGLVMNRPAFTVLLITLIAILSFGVSACSGLPPLASLSQLANQSQATPETTLFIPKQAPFVAAALLSPQQQTQVLFASESSVLGTSGLSYAKDIQPWVGDEVAFAVTTTDLDRDRANGNQPGYLLAFTVTRPQKAQAFLLQLWQKRAVPSEDLEVETYQGVALTYQDDEFEPQRASLKPRGLFRSLATAQVGDRYILIANHPKVLRDAINNAQAPDLSLSSTSSYQAAVKRLSEKQWGWVFANIPALGEWSQSAGKPLKTPDVPPYRFDKLAIALRSQRNGIAADTLFLAAPEQIVDEFSPTLNPSVLSVLNYLPVKSSLGVVGQDLATLWPALKTGLQGYPTLLSLLEQPQLTFAQQSKTSLFDQVINWVHGQYGLGMVPTSTQPDWIFAAERSLELDSTLETLNTLAQQQGYTTVDITIEGQPVTTWTQLQTETATQPGLQTTIGAAHTTIGEYELFATSVDAMKMALTAKQGASLSDSSLYQRAISPLASPNAGTVYLDWPAARPVLEKGIPLIKWLTWGAPNLFEDLKTVTLTSLPSEAGTRHNLISVQVK
jgi:hypothetical protein